ncbi:MAG: hypothetical protein ACOC7L_02095 [Acidobacteriota bacterium]
MSFRTNPDRILDSIDRARTRDEEARADQFTRDASARELDTEVPSADATPTERLRRLFGLVERAYKPTASSPEMRRLAERFQTVGDISHHHARGDVSVSFHYMDHERSDDVGVTPFEVLSSRFDEVRKSARSSRPDAVALRILREELRNGVLAAYRKMEPRLRDAIRERADKGHVAAQITMDLRPAE